MTTENSMNNLHRALMKMRAPLTLATVKQSLSRLQKQRANAKVEIMFEGGEIISVHRTETVERY